MNDDNDDEYSLDDFTRLSSIQESKVADQEDDDTYTCFSEEQFNPADRGLSDEHSSKLVCADDDASPDKEGRQVPGGGGIVPFAQRNDSEP